MVVWVYAGGGQAELGIVPWLEHHFPGVKFERRLPQIRKPGPRPGVAIKHEVIGQTGTSLDLTIRRNLSEHWKPNAAQILLLLDDTDCESPTMRRESLEQAVVAGISEVVPPVAIALAVPELEGWLLADWQHTFAKDYRHCHVPMRDNLKKEGVDFDAIESFDCRCGTPNYRKISETLRSAFEVCCGTSPGYSKDTDTRRLLLQVQPDVVATSCPHFKRFWNDLKTCMSQVTTKSG